MPLHHFSKYKKYFFFSSLIFFCLVINIKANDYSQQSSIDFSFNRFFPSHSIRSSVYSIEKVSNRRRLTAADEDLQLEQDNIDFSRNDDSNSIHSNDLDDSIDAPEVVNVQGQSLGSIRARISTYRLQLDRLKNQIRDMQHEKAFLEKTLELKKGQRTMQDGQVRLSQAELEDKAKEIAMYRREAPRTLMRYNQLVRQQKQMQDTLNRLHTESEQLTSSKSIIMHKMHTLRMEDLIERHARALPDAFAGALRKSAAALIPFFDYLFIAADTNNRLVDHVGAEIDKYTHVDIAKSPFMSGVLFYCVLLVPLLTLISFVRRIFDSSSKLTASHYIIFGNLYFLIMCLFNVFLTMFFGDDPINMSFRKYERSVVITNLLLALYYLLHVSMLGIQAAYTFQRRDLAQFIATLSVGVHYFIFAWRKIFTDNPPLMYTFNYLVYGTIFAFVLYERYNRMSSKQLHDSVILRLIYPTMKRISHLRSRPLRLETIKIFFNELWTSWNKPSRGLDRNSSKRLVGKFADKKDFSRSAQRRETNYNNQLSISDDDTDEDEYSSDEPLAHEQQRRSISHRKRSKTQERKSSRPAQTRSFIRMFFGNRENADDETTEEEEDDDEEMPSRTGWHMLSRFSSGSRQPGRTSMRYEARSPSHEEDTRNDSRRQSRSSLWKWT